MLDILQLIHRQTVRRTLRGIEAKTNGSQMTMAEESAAILDGSA